MYYIIYKITNLINNKYYIGKHQTNNLNDGYMGSGRRIVKAIQKYGLENFKKEILHIFDNEAEMNKKEKELVVISENTYNLCPGGQGGFGYINSNEKLRKAKNKKAMKIAIKNRILEKAAIGLKKKFSDKEWVKNFVAHHQKVMLDRYGQIGANGFLGKKHSDKSIEKMKESHKGKHSGIKNSQYGTYWITNGTENKKCRSKDIPQGWYKGRTLK